MLGKPRILSLFLNSFNKFNKTWALMYDPLLLLTNNFLLSAFLLAVSLVLWILLISSLRKFHLSCILAFLSACRAVLQKVMQKIHNVVNVLECWTLLFTNKILVIRAGSHKMLQGRPWSDFFFKSSLLWVSDVCLCLFGRQLVFEILEH